MLEILRFDVQPPQILYHLVTLAAAVVLSLPIAWNRERATRQMGLRTFPLVALASTGFVLMGEIAMPDDVEAQARILQGLITGVGFLGGGAIVKQGLSVLGTATAASIWNTAAMGAAVAHGAYEIAIVLSLVNAAVLWGLTPLKRELDGANDPDGERGGGRNGDRHPEDEEGTG